MIPVIDLFAGPGGLGEGFSSLSDDKGERIFKIALSIEKDEFAHKTLLLRSFFRQFPAGKVPNEYYYFLQRKIKDVNILFDLYPDERDAAFAEAWKAELGKIPDKQVDTRIKDAIGENNNWLLIGGPPCQAYSVVGRSRRKEKILDEKKDARVGLYKQYLRILAVHNPAVFVMENVKGLLSAETKDSPVFSMILKDLADPVAAYKSEYDSNGNQLNCPGYKIYSLASSPESFDIFGNPDYKHRDYLIYSEKYGVPQTRHRVILLGVRRDIDIIPDVLNEQREVPISKVLSGLPKLRSGLSKSEKKNDAKTWLRIVKQTGNNKIIGEANNSVKKIISQYLKELTVPHNNIGAEYIEYKNVNVKHEKDWFLDEKIKGVCNHISRGHMESDIYRYFFISCFAKVFGRSPKLEDFPQSLWPAHINVANAQEGIEDAKFVDRFKVQLWDEPAKTITSHISKDGHYYIHPDPVQCRSFTVREAARIQTFPDNYFFMGPRTAQFIQVGNAVPPILAFKIAKIIQHLISEMLIKKQPSMNYILQARE